MKSIYKISLVVTLAAVLASCTSQSTHNPLLNSEPAAGSTLTRAPRTLRLFFEALPDVSRSNLLLSGPAGEYQLRGMHSMGEDDLMVEIYQPAVVNGDYTVHWSAVVEGGSQLYQGSFAFAVKVD